jgi:hypothetical protein
VSPSAGVLPPSAVSMSLLPYLSWAQDRVSRCRHGLVDAQPWSGWLEEHPDGGFVVLPLDRGKEAVIARSYEGLEAGLAELGDEPYQLIRVPRMSDTYDPGFLDRLRELYPPSDPADP